MVDTIRLGELCHARSGDKGDMANVGLVCFDGSHYEWVRDKVTASAVAEFMGRWVKGPVERFEIPKSFAFNFLLHGALGGGVSRSAMVDGHGKNYSSILLEMEIEDPRLRAAA